MTIDKHDNMQGLKSSGLAGMSPKRLDADLFIEKMKKTGAIDEAIFSFSIGLGQKPNRMTFGGYDIEKYAKGG